MATKKTKKDKRKNNNKIFKGLLLLMIIGIIIYTLYRIIDLIIVPTDICIVNNGVIAQEESAIGYVIRDEKIAKGNNHKNGIYQIKAEGEKVAKGDEVFRYYSSNEESLNKNINELNDKIQEAMMGQTNLFSADVKAIENQIENEINGLKYKNNIQEIAENKKDIDTYITKKAKIAGELSQAGSYINGLIQERDRYQSELKANSEYVKSSMSGVVSYRVDNLEEVLTPNNFTTLNKEMLEKLNLKTGQIVATNGEMGKIINNYECYIATVLESEEAKEAQIGKKVVLRLSSQDEVDASIEYLKVQDDNSVLIVFKINNSVEKLINYRKISFDIIWWRYEGLKVPKSAIISDKGLKYIVRNRAGYYNKILVKILKETDNYCIVDNYDYKELKSLGYSGEDVYNVRKISIYDEIIINPSLEDFNE